MYRTTTTSVAGYKNVTHEQCVLPLAANSLHYIAGYKNVTRKEVGITNYLSSVMGALMVETPQSVPTAPSMHRLVLVIVELCLETIYDNAVLQSLGRCLLYAYNALG